MPCLLNNPATIDIIHLFAAFTESISQCILKSILSLAVLLLYTSTLVPLVIRSKESINLKKDQSSFTFGSSRPLGLVYIYVDGEKHEF